MLEVDTTKPGNYMPESMVEERFEEIKPMLLTCISDILSRAIGIKEKIASKYSLGRMADALVWGEAISQAMGNDEKKFIDAYSALASIQHIHVVKSDPLLVIYQKFFYDIFENPDTANSYIEERKCGYKIFDYPSLQNRLNDIAESEGYETGKGNKLWPKDSQQLADRSRDVSSKLRKTSSISLEIRKGKDRSNEFILGTIEGVEGT
ncbi:MAG: hypothetical protein WBZ36_09030 [Candidatus Nitrosopolaris sp.]